MCNCSLSDHNSCFTLWFVGIHLLSIAFQTISVSVSVLTLSCIAQDRWYAICHPLKFKSTAKRARKSIILIWLVSCVIMIPQAIVMECSSLLPELTNKTSLFTVCDEQWAGKRYFVTSQSPIKAQQGYIPFQTDHLFLLWEHREIVRFNRVLTTT